MEGAARETGIPVVISSRYRPNSAALSLVPRATRTTRRGRCFSTRRLSFSTLRNSVERVRSSASGCCRLSSSIRDIDFKIAGVGGGQEGAHVVGGFLPCLQNDYRPTRQNHYQPSAGWGKSAQS